MKLSWTEMTEKVTAEERTVGPNTRSVSWPRPSAASWNKSLRITLLLSQRYQLFQSESTAALNNSLTYFPISLLTQCKKNRIMAAPQRCITVTLGLTQ
jgi:hypothetical protein